MDMETMRAAFEVIYSNDLWGNGSGPGSSPASTIEYRAYIQRFIVENDVRSVTDLGCGDWQFSRLLDWRGIAYTGLDIVPNIVEANQNRFGGEGLKFDLFDGIDSLPGGDLLICKEVLQHLPNDLVIAYVDRIRCRYRWALLTNAVERSEDANRDIPPGGWRPLRLDRPPFKVPGAVVLSYFPQSGSHYWKNHIYLVCGLAA